MPPPHHTVAMAAFVLCLVGLPASAAERPPAQEAMRRHCAGDYMAHCGEHAPGGPEVEACFRTKRRLLSPACTAAIVEYRRELRASRAVTQAR